MPSFIGDDPIGISAKVFGIKKTRVPGLSCSVVCMILYLAVLVEL